jgi:hypothetical protein
MITDKFCAKDDKPTKDGEQAKACVAGPSIYQISIHVMTTYSLESSKLIARLYF